MQNRNAVHLQQAIFLTDEDGLLMQPCQFPNLFQGGILC